MHFYYIWLGLLITLTVGQSSTLTTRYRVAGLMLFLFAAVRGSEIDRDYLAYLNLYVDVVQYNFQNIEPSFIVVSRFVNFWFGNVLWLFIIYAALGILIKLFAISKIANFKILTLILYYCNFYLIWEMTQIRVAVAGALILLAIIPLADRKYVHYIILCSIATLFHFTALILFSVLFINSTKLHKKFYAILIPIGCILWYLSVDFTDIALYVPLDLVNQKIVIYQNAVELSGNPFNYLFICRCAFAYFLLVHAERLLSINRFFVVFLKFYFLGLFLHVGLFVVPGVATRLSELFLVVEIFLIPMVIVFFKERVIGYIIVCLISFSFLIVSVQNTDLLLPYYINRAVALELF
jgi:EpsG family